MTLISLSPAGHRYGRYRDNIFNPARKLRALPANPAVVIPPTAMELCVFKGPTRNQGQEGSCCGQAGAEKIDLDYRQFTDWPDRTIAPIAFEASAEFVYLCDLIADGNLGTDAGSSLHQTAMTLSQKGACLDAAMKYSDHQYSTPPNASQIAAGLPYRMDAYHFLPDLASMKACLAPSPAGPGHSFIFGINVYSSFEADWAQPGFMPVPNLANEQLLGGHAQHVIGYDDTIVFPKDNASGLTPVGGLFVQNSWGDSGVWGAGIDAPGHTDGGCYWMSYAFVNGNDPTNGPFVSDAWVSHTGPIWK